MKILRTIAEFRDWRAGLAPSAVTPFVPTMGALHEGHASLVRQARALANQLPARGTVIASIFVNPTQFGPNEDYTRYPRTLDADATLLQSAGADAVFVPTAQEMYPGLGKNSEPGILNSVSVEPGALGSILEGGIRPGHFRGVCTVVAKLLLITQPTHLLLGQKDYQQQAIIRQMCIDLNFPCEVITCPTARESDGLAMSSRNRYLSPDERARAVALFEALNWAKQAWEKGERRASILDAGMEERLISRGLVPQYALVADALTLAPFRDSAAGVMVEPAVLLIAAKLGSTRLIDNMLL